MAASSGLSHSATSSADAGGVGLDHRPQRRARAAMRRTWPSATACECDAPDVRRCVAPRGAEQAVLDALEMLADDEQAASGQQRVDVGHAAGEAVLAGQHGELGARPRAPPRSRASKVSQGSVRHAGKGGAAGEVGIGAGQALEGDRAGHAVARPGPARAGALEVGRRVDAERARARRGRRRSACRPPARAAAPASRAAPAGIPAGDEAGQRRAAIGVDADMVPERPLAPGDRRAREIQRRRRPRGRASKAQAALTTEGGAASSAVVDRRDQGGDVDRRVGERREHGAQLRRAAWSAGRPAG